MVLGGTVSNSFPLILKHPRNFRAITRLETLATQAIELGSTLYKGKNTHIKYGT